ncbi:MAG: glycerol-3-phosphate dehydrogenase/oxidase [Chloroflexi bacterium]|nr:glycerol-3-phosphate dehydrogenase/oxidase [Chloroflexota bacterium]
MTLSEVAAGPPLDAAIIGGGINGCAIALACARRGLNVGLFEQDDFGFGTTWRSTKLIHGGLRYLEHGDVRLVFESLRERAWLLKTRPYLVRPQRFLLPMLPWTRRPPWQLRAGLALYDTLALYRGVPRHHALSDARLHGAMPSLPGTTRGGFAFYDARVLAPERLALELAIRARELGATIENHARVRAIVTRSGSVDAVRVEHQGQVHEIRANAVINAAGPWVDAVNALTGEAAPALLGVTRGSHIVVEPRHAVPRDAVFSTARSDGRVFFAVPQGDLLLIGTTDDRFDAPPGEVRPVAADVDYLLAEAGELLPGLALDRARVRYAYAGLRPLRRVAGGPEAAITRRHDVIDHRTQGGPGGLYSVIGGKLSTFRPLAAEVSRRLTRDHPYVPELPPPPAISWRAVLRASEFDHSTRQHLRIYGDAVSEVVDSGAELICPHAHALSGELVHAIAREQATTLSDILMRRTGISWASCRGLCCHERAAGVAAELLGWDDDRRAREIAAFEADVAYHLPTVESLYEGDARGSHNRPG